MNKMFIIGAIISIAVIGAIAFHTPSVEAHDNEMIVHMDASCGCCSAYATYADRSYQVTTIIESDISGFKRSTGVPASMQSCHTTMIEDYFVEGHVPVEAIEKLLEERPDIAGIAIPGMPSGSPGMPGAPRPMTVHAVNHDGSTTPFMEV